MVDEVGENPKQVKSEEREDDEDYPYTSNQSNAKEEEMNGAPEE